MNNFNMKYLSLKNRRIQLVSDIYCGKINIAIKERMWQQKL